MKAIILATRNPGKVREVRKILGVLAPGVRLVPLSAFPRAKEVKESGSTLEVNAARKARYAAEISGMPALAEDSGLFVNALRGRPGVRSSRYSGRGDKANNEKLLWELRNVPAARRGAAYKCVAALATPKGKVFFSRGECKGRIAFEEKGRSGFGYDPLFIPRGFGKTFAQLGRKVKDGMSHRARALERMVPFIRKIRAA